MRNETRWARSLRWWHFALLAAGVAALLFAQRAPERKARRPPPPARTALVHRGAIAERAVARGRLEPVAISRVSAGVAGRVARVFASPGAEVRKRQRLAALDDRSLAAARDGAVAAVDLAEAALVRALIVAAHQQHRLQATAALFAAGQATQIELDEAEAATYVAATEVRMSGARLSKAKAAAARARLELEETIVRAPFAGTVVSRSTEPGQTVQKNGAALFTIAAEPRRLRLRARLAEETAARIQPGAVAVVAVVGSPALSATVLSAAASGDGSSELLLEVAAPVKPALSGRSATASLVLDERRDALLVPAAAIWSCPGQVMVLRDGTQEPVELRLGIREGELVEVLDGPLRDGDRVVLPDHPAPPCPRAAPEAPRPAPAAAF